MSTSLSEQLQKLALPQSSVYEETKKKPSLLFNPKEAASKDRDTFYEIGLSGLKELVEINKTFRVFENTLFNISSKDFERSVQTAETNKILNEDIKKFLLHLSPYLMLQSSHKCLEWLVNRYSIQEYNQDEVMMLILPYHETKLFVRFIQIMNLKKNTNKWQWLAPLQKPGIHLAKQVLYNHCGSNPAILKFIAKSVITYIKVLNEQAHLLSTIFGFFCSCVIGSLESVKKIDGSHINAILSTILKALLSPVIDLRYSSFIILGYISSRAQLKGDIIDNIMVKLFSSEFDLTYEVVLLVNIMCTHQDNLKTFPIEIIYDINPDAMHILCHHLKNLIEKHINVLPLITKLISTLVVHIQGNNEDFKRLCNLPEILVEELDLKTQNPDEVIRCLLDSFEPSQYKDGDGYESDLEIIEENKIINNEMTEWYSQLLKRMEIKYPTNFDTTVKQVMKVKVLSENRKEQLTVILGFKPAISHKIGDTFLFEKLNHINPLMRIEAARYINKHFSTLKSIDETFLKESILKHFSDDNPDVIKALLKIPLSWFEEILNPEELTNVFLNILQKNKKPDKWLSVIKETVESFETYDSLNINLKAVLIIIPFLFPADSKHVEIVYGFLNSTWANKVEVLKIIKDVLLKLKENKNCNIICEAVFSVFESGYGLEDLFVSKDFISEDTATTTLHLFLRVCTLNSYKIETMTWLLKEVIDLINNNQIILAEDNELTGNLIPIFLESAKENKILFPFVFFTFDKLIDYCEFKNLRKPWIDHCHSSEGTLTKQLYEIFITGCSLQNYSKPYAVLLKKLFSKLCVDKKEIVEFCSNFVCGHIYLMYSKEQYITRELQLRSLKFIHELLKQNEESSWIFDTTLPYSLLFALDCKTETIRYYAMEVISFVLNNSKSAKSCLKVLFDELYSRKDQIILDGEQISLILYTLLSQEKTVRKALPKKLLVPMKSCFDLALSILTDSDTPNYVALALLVLLKLLNSAEFLTKIVILSYRKVEIQTALDIYDSGVLKHIISKINMNSIKCTNNENVWDFVASCLTFYKKDVIDEKQSLVSPCELMLKQLDNYCYSNLSEAHRGELIKLICMAGTFTSDTTIVSRTSKLVKKLDLCFKDFEPILNEMLNVKDPIPTKQKKRSSTLSLLSYHTADTKEWKCGVTLLEYLQTKKQLTFDENCVPLLFKLLNRCLEFEEQSYVEYSKQLLLSIILNYCLKVNSKDETQILKSLFDIEAVVKCIRGTQNPQTHNHSLMLLSHAALLLPEQVLTHIMAIFTFIGSSVLRHDDAYSFQIIIKIIETIIPILVSLDTSLESCTEKEMQKLQSRVVPVLRIFAEVVLDVPEHRRLPLYKKLIDTLQSSHFLWIMLALLLEAHINHFSDNKVQTIHKQKSLLNEEQPITRIDFAQVLLMEYSPGSILDTMIKLIQYAKTLPMQKVDDSMDTDINPADVFCIAGHSAVQLRHFRYTIVTFMNTVLSTETFKHHSLSATNIEELETHYKTFIVNILVFITVVSKVTDETSTKYWKVMLHHSYDLLDKVNNLLSAPMFVSVVRGLLNHNLQTVRRKAMDLLNLKIQSSPEVFDECDRDLLFSLLPALMTIVETIEDPNKSNGTEQEVESNQQTALLSLKLLTRMLASEKPTAFEIVLKKVTTYLREPEGIPGNVMASIVLCLAELCTNLGAYTISYLPKFMPALIKILKKQRAVETPELILLSTITAVCKIVEKLPLFLSPYLKKIVYEYAVLMTKWQKIDQECTKVVAVMSKLANIKTKLATSIAPRVLVPVVSESCAIIMSKEDIAAVAPVMAILAENFANVTNSDFVAMQLDLSQFFIQTLQLRCDFGNSPSIDKVEDEVINAFVCLVLKLSESSFRPFYFKMYDWAIRINSNEYKDRCITFYRLTCVLADRLKGLFVLFAGHFISNSSEMLDACNNSKASTLFFESETKCEILVENLLKTLKIVFLYDSQNFLNKERFEVLLQPIVDQLENTIGGLVKLQERVKNILNPCISQLALTIADDSLWKPLNYQILLKMRHSDAEIRLLALECFVDMASKLGTNWLPLLAESVPFLAEMLEDGDSRVEEATKEAVRNLEQILGESLQKYM